MKAFMRKFKIPVIIVASVLVIALIVTGILMARKPKSNKVSGETETTTTESEVVVDDGDNITAEEWIILVAQKFGLNSYVNSSPYFENVKDDSPIFAYVQSMVENEILENGGAGFEADVEMEQKAALIQLSKIYGDTYIENRLEKEKLAEEDYIKFATENIGVTLTAVSDGFSYTEANNAIDKAWEHYLSKEYGNFEEIEYTENVIDLSAVEDYVYENNTVLVSTKQEITEGKVLVFATRDEYKSLFAVKVTSVEKEGDNYILDVTEPTLDEIVESMNIEFSQIANFDNFIPAEGITVLAGESVVSTGFDHSGSEKTFEVNFTDNKMKFSDEWEAIHGKLSLNGISTDNINYFKDAKGNMMSKYKEGVEIVGKITIKDLILKGFVEYDDKLEFNMEAGATISSSLSIKGKKEEQIIRVGELPITTFGSPVSFVVDIYLVATLEGEIKVEPKVTAIASAKKCKNSGVSFTGNVTTSDLNSSITGKVKLAVCPDAVVTFYGLADILDLYIEAGVGADAKYDLTDPTKLVIEMYAPTLKAGVGKDKKSILSGVLGIKYEVNIMDKKDALFKCLYTEEIVVDFPAIIDYLTGEETTTEEPTSESVENITEQTTQSPTEAPKPTKPVTEATKPTEPVTDAPKPTEPALPQYELSGQTYEYANYYGDNYYIVKINGVYGVVDFYGNVVIPIQYEDYKNVGHKETEFILGNNSYVYDNVGNLVYQYVNKEVIIDETKYPLIDGLSIKQWSSTDSNCYLLRQYNSGVLIEEVEYLIPYSNNRYESDTYVSFFRFINAKNGTVILEEYGFYRERYYLGVPGNGLYVSNFVEEKVILLSDFDKNDIKMYIISSNGYVEKDISIQNNCELVPYSSYVGDGYYCDGWLKFPYVAMSMINVNTLETINIPYNDYFEFDSGSVYYFYFGRDIWYGVSTSEEGLFDLVKGSTIISSGYEWLDFGSDKYILTRKNGLTGFIDYNTGQEVKQYVNATTFNSQGYALVDDSNGLCYVDTSFNRVSEYIYTGEYESFTSKSIKIGGKYYLIRQK